MALKHIPLYNVENSVGKGGVNREDDVLLVKYFLSEVAKVPPHPLPPPAQKLEVDAKPSLLLNEWILWYQKGVNLSGRSCATDGRIDPARAHNNNMYGGNGTICHLNMSFRKRFRAAHNALETHGDCPPFLRLRFSKDVY